MQRIKHSFYLLLCWLPLASAEPTAPSAAPFAWSVSAPGDGKAAVVQHILLGSVHLLPSESALLPPGLQQAYAQTRGLVLETNPAALKESGLQKRIRKTSRTDKGQTLADLIEPSLYEQVRQRAVALDLSAKHCDNFRAWFCALSLELSRLHQEGLDSQYGIDHQFYDRARRDKRTVRWLEPAADQIALFTDMDAAMGAQFLAAALRGLADPAGKPAELLRQWREDDRVAMERSVAEMQREYPAIYQRVLLNRNQAWMAPLEAYLREADAQLVVVGAAHLVGPQGLPNLLAARGWTVQALPVTGASAALSAKAD